MIGKCLVLLSVAFGIASASCFQVPQVQYELRQPQVCSSQFVSSPVVSKPVQFVQVARDCQLRGGVATGAVLASSSAIATDGPETAPLPMIRAPDVTLPVVEGPVVALPSQPIPAPRVISQRCICTKTIVKPQVIQRQITIPKVQRYLKRTVTPIVENLAYKSRPVSSQSRQAPVAIAATGYASGSAKCYSRIC